MDTKSQVWPEIILTLKERRPEYPGVDTYIFTSQAPVLFEAGQYVHVRLSGMPEGEKPVREFSFASAPSDEEIWFGIDYRSRSAYQARLQEMNPGDTLVLFKIKSHMTWPPESEEVVLIAGGIGITPFRSMIRDIAHKKLPIRSYVIHASSDHYAYAQELAPMSSEYTKVVRADLMSAIDAKIKSMPEAHYYVAGSPLFVEAVIEKLKSSGILKIESDPFKGLLEA